MALHAAAVSYLLPPSFVRSDAPVLFADYTVHLRSCLLYLQRRTPLAQWTYDPFQMAGYPANLAESASNHAAEVFVATFGAERPVVAFKVWLLLSFLAVPPLVAGAAAALGRSAGEVAAAAWVSSIAWCLDPTFRLFREFGGSGFPLACALCLLAAALGRRFLERGGAGPAVAVIGAAAAAVWVHALSLLVLAVATVTSIAVAPPAATARRRAALPALLLAGVAPALPWLLPTVENSRWLTSTAYRLAAAGAADLAGVLLFAPGVRVESALLWLGVTGSVLLWRRQPEIGRWLAPPVAVWLLLALVPLPPLRGLQPRRFMMTALIWLVPAVVAAGNALLARLRPALRAAALAAVALTTAAFQLLPWLQVAAGSPLRIASLADRARVPDDVGRLVAWVAARPRDGRVLLEDMDHIANEAYGGTFIGALLPLWTGVPLLGGPSEQPFLQQAVDLTYGRWLGHELTSLDAERFAALVDRYAVHWIVAVNPGTERYLARQSAVVAPTERWGRFATFAVRSPARLAAGAAAVELGLGRVSVRGATLPVTTVAVHWHQCARTVPRLPLERVVYPDDPVGLIRVGNGGVRDFVVVFE